MITSKHPAYTPAVQFAEYVSQQQAAVFVGAGLSIAAGYPDWKDLLAPRATALGVDIDHILDFPALAQYAVNECAGNKSLIENFIAMQVKKAPILQPIHYELAKLPVTTIWTTNYDDALEIAFAAYNPDVKVGDKSLLSGVVPSRVTIYKMHGTVKPHPSDIIISQDDYEHYFLRYPLMCRQLSSDFATKSFLFLGISFHDPNIKHNMAQLRGFLRGSTRTHFLIYKTPKPENAREHNLWLRDLSRYGIVGMQVTDWAEIPEVLQLIVKRSFPRSVLVSGSHDGIELEHFCSSLGREIAAQRIVILSGEGRNVTTFVSEGAFNYLIDKGQDYTPMIQLFRIPKFTRRSSNQRYRLTYRRQLTKRARLAIIIAGQDGTLEEVMLCSENRIPLLPVKWTGGTAEIVWNNINTDPSHYVRNFLSEEEMLLLATRPSESEIDAYTVLIVDVVLRLLNNGISHS
jgi:hypothetical protein